MRLPSSIGGTFYGLETGLRIGGLALESKPVEFRQIECSVDPPRTLSRRRQFVGTVGESSSGAGAMPSRLPPVDTLVE